MRAKRCARLLAALLPLFFAALLCGSRSPGSPPPVRLASRSYVGPSATPTRVRVDPNGLPASLTTDFASSSPPSSVVPAGSLVTPPPSPDPGRKTGQSEQGPVVMGEIVADGRMTSASHSFDAGTQAVNAQFQTMELKPGQQWESVWAVNGTVVSTVGGIVGQDTTDEWKSIPLVRPNGLPGGQHTVTLYVDDKPIQQVSFAIAPAAARTRVPSAAFGPVTFSQDVSEDEEPIEPGTVFDLGIERVYATFPYYGMTEGQSWRREWLRDDRRIAGREAEWNLDSQGVTHVNLYDEDGLAAGRYTLNLYIGDQVARGGTFEIRDPSVKPTPVRTPTRSTSTTARRATPTPEADVLPEDLIDAELLPAWRRLSNSSVSLLHRMAQVVLDWRIPVRLTDRDSAAAYIPKVDCNHVAGRIEVRRSYWQKTSEEEVAASLAHELAHAVQLLGGASCHCTIEGEFQAFVTELYALQAFGRWDVLKTRFGGVYDENGRFDENRLYEGIRQTYSDCD